MIFFDTIKRILTAETTKNSAKLISANVVAQVIGLLIYPVITRLYAPEDFGLFNLFSSIGGILVLLATAEYQYAIVLPKRDKDAIALFQTGCFIALAVTALITLTIPFRYKIAGLFNTPELADWYFLLPLFVAGSALWNLLNYWLTRKKQFSNISIYQLSQSIISAGSKYFFGISGFLAGGLIVSSVIGCISAFIVSLTMALRKYAMQFAHVSISRCKYVAKRYANFPKFSLVRAFINTLSGNLLFLLLTPFFDIAEIGFLGMAFTLGFRPINMIVSTLYQVLFQKTAYHVQNQQSIWPFFRKYIIMAATIVIPCFAGLYFILPWLTEWLLGAGWNATGNYLRILLPWLLVILLGSSISYIPDIFLQQKISMYLEIIYTILRLCVLCIGIGFHDFQLTILLYSILGTIMIAGQIIWYLYLISNYEKGIHQA